jgi:hypothetical protein
MLRAARAPLIATLVGGLFFMPCTALAAQSSAQFSVTVDLQGGPASPGSPTPSSQSAFCRLTNAPGAFGATVVVVCSTGVVVDEIAPSSRNGTSRTPYPSGAYRFATQVTPEGLIIDQRDIYSGLGTITSWRRVNLIDRDYIEMTVNW